MFSIFLAWFSSPIEGPAMITMGGRGRKSQPKKSKPPFSIFLAQFSSPIGGFVVAVKGRWWKSQPKKSNLHFRFFWRDFRYPSKILRWLRWRGECGWLGDKNRDWKNRIDVFNFFWPQFLSSSFPPSQSQDPQICDIASSSNIFENLKFSKMFDKDAIPRIRRSCNCGGVGEWITKIVAEKNRRLRSRSAFLWRLPPLSQTGWWSRSAFFDTIKLLSLSYTPELLSCSTRPLGQVAPPIWPGDLQCRRAFMAISKKWLETTENNPDIFKRFITRDENWMNHFEPPFKQQSATWKTTITPRQKKVWHV